MADLRAISMAMLPVFSSGYRSTDSEAMNIIEVLREVQEICNGSVKIYSGNGHTTSRVAAGMAFLSYGVIAAGRIINKPTKPLQVVPIQVVPIWPSYNIAVMRGHLNFLLMKTSLSFLIFFVPLTFSPICWKFIWHMSIRMEDCCKT